MKYIIILMLSFVLVGCGTHVDSKPQVTQELLLQPCTKDTPLPQNITVDSTGQKGYDGKELFATLRAWDATYAECSTRLDALIAILRKYQGQNITLNIKE